ncbi:MAG: hypothetical protein PF904_00480 [Kiritimatiellae bacterium]|jgi:biopolymer transport protein ExbD|nr:hypothetical protein [Kiritimatiellia bacterium]
MATFIKNMMIVLIAANCCMSCTTSRVIENSRIPEVEIDTFGKIWINDKPVKLGKIGRTLQHAGFRREQEVNILVADTRDRRTMRAVTSDLVKRGFTRSVFITNKSATSSIKKKR